MMSAFRSTRSEYVRGVMELCLSGGIHEAAEGVLLHYISMKRRFIAQRHKVEASNCSEYDQSDREVTDTIADLVEVCLEAIDRRIDEDGQSPVYGRFEEFRDDPLEIAIRLVECNKAERARMLSALTASANLQAWPLSSSGP